MADLNERLLASADGFAKFAQEGSMADLLREAADEIARLRAATLSPPLPSLEVERLKAALEEIVNPLQFLKQRAAATGDRLSDMAYSITNDVEYLRGIARAALSALPLDGGLSSD